MPDSHFFFRAGPFPLKDLARIGDATLADVSMGEITITDIAPLDSAGSDDITFLSNTKYTKQLNSSKAKACILAPKSLEHAPKNMALLVSPNPYATYAKIAQAFYPEVPPVAKISPHAIIAPSATIGKNCSIAPGVVIGEHVVIGDHVTIEAGTVLDHHVQVGKHSHIHSHVTLRYCHIGTHAIIHPGVRIGQDGFGFATDKGVHIKVPQLGRVIIGNHVEIGANTCIDRGTIPDTIIGDGCKIDNLVQIGHNVQLGKGCIVVGQSGISGSTQCGDYIICGGQTGIAGHLTIGSMANIAAGSGVINDIAPKQIVGGFPAIPIKQWHRQTVALKHLIGKRKKYDE